MRIKRLLMLLLVFIMMIQLTGITHAKGDVKLNHKKKTIYVGESFTLSVKNAKKTYKPSVSKKAVSLKKLKKNQWKVTGIKKGTVTITIKTKLKKYTCKVTVKNRRISKKATKFYSHRGLSNKYPENSYKAQMAACKSGYYGTNCDVWPTKKDKKGHYDFAVSHNNSLYAMTGKKKKISQLTAKQVVKYRITKGKNAKKYKNQHVLLLKTILKMSKKHKKRVQIELKGRWSTKQISQFVSQIKKYKMSGRVTIESMNITNLIRFKKIAKKQKLRAQTNYVCPGNKRNAMKSAKLCKRYKITNIVTHYHLVNKQLVSYCKKNHVGCSAYVPVGQSSRSIVAGLLKYKLYSIGVPDKPWN